MTRQLVQRQTSKRRLKRQEKRSQKFPQAKMPSKRRSRHQSRSPYRNLMADRPQVDQARMGQMARAQVVEVTRVANEVEEQHKYPSQPCPKYILR
jgi:hypothetical protein